MTNVDMSRREVPVSLARVNAHDYILGSALPLRSTQREEWLTLVVFRPLHASSATLLLFIDHKKTAKNRDTRYFG